MENLAQDIRYTIRTLLRAPGFSFVVILSIALAFAANATVFSVANGLLWGVLPVQDPGRMVMFSEGNSFSYPDYIDYRDQTSDIFEGGIAAHFPLIPASIGGKGVPERVWGQAVSGNFFPIWVCRWRWAVPSFPKTTTVARDHVAVLSNGLWRRRFGGDANILNREVALNGQHYTVVGVAPPVSTAWIAASYRSSGCRLPWSEEIMPDLATDGSAEPSETINGSCSTPGSSPESAAPRLQCCVNVVKKRLDDT